MGSNQPDVSPASKADAMRSDPKGDAHSDKNVAGRPPRGLAPIRPPETVPMSFSGKVAAPKAYRLTRHEVTRCAIRERPEEWPQPEHADQRTRADSHWRQHSLRRRPRIRRDGRGRPRAPAFEFRLRPRSLTNSKRREKIIAKIVAENSRRRDQNRDQNQNQNFGVSANS